MSKRLRWAMRQSWPHIRFWSIHASHWMIAIVFAIFTFGLVYLLFANDAVFAKTVLGS